MSPGTTSPRHVVVAIVAVVAVIGGCTGPRPQDSSPTSTPGAAAPPALPTTAKAARELAADPVRLADDLVADERALRDPAAPEDVLAAAAHRQQAAYRAIGHHPEWDSVVRPRIPATLLDVYDLNVDARRQLSAMARPKDTVPAWRIVAPRPADELMGYYRQAESASGVAWNYLAAINLIETAFGRVAGVSTAGAQGPMQFMPSTFDAYGQGGDIQSPRDSIMAAGRYLAANGFAGDRDHALFRYNNSHQYVRAVHDYAAAIAAYPTAFAGYHRWDVYYNTTAGDVLLPVGYSADAPRPAAEYLSDTGSPASPDRDVRMPGASAEILEQLLAVVRQTSAADPATRAATLSSRFLGTPYGAHTLIGSSTEPEALVVDLAQVDCFTMADYVEALKASGGTRDGFIEALVRVRYKEGNVGFLHRRHFFTDWAASKPTVATDITADLSDNAVQVTKQLNQKDSGGVYLPGLPVVARTLSYVPSSLVDDGVLGRLHTGDYVGAYAEDGGLDVTHVGIFIDGPDGPVLRNASSLNADQKVVDTPFFDYLTTVPGVVVLRPA